MRKRFLIALLCGAMMVAPGLVPPAGASHFWLSIGTAFRIGPAFISFVFAPPGYYGGYRPSYFYRFDRPIYYPGLHCSRYCFHEGGYYYHHASCPLAAAHFSYYGVDPYWAYDRYAPRYDGYDGDYGYDGYGGYDGYRGGYGYYDGGYGYYDGRGYDRYYGYRGGYSDRYDDRRYGDRRYDGYRGDDHRYDGRRHDDRRGYDGRRDGGRYGHDWRDRDDGHRGSRGHEHHGHRGHGDD